jgi:hypothetical protein
LYFKANRYLRATGVASARGSPVGVLGIRFVKNFDSRITLADVAGWACPFAQCGLPELLRPFAGYAAAGLRSARMPSPALG